MKRPIVWALCVYIVFAAGEECQGECPGTSSGMAMLATRSIVSKRDSTLDSQEPTLVYSNADGYGVNFEKRHLVEGVVCWNDRHYTYTNIVSSGIPLGATFWAGPHKKYGTFIDRKVTLNSTTDGVLYFWSESSPPHRDGAFPLKYGSQKVGTMNWGDKPMQVYSMFARAGETEIFFRGQQDFVGGFAWAPKGILLEVETAGWAFGIKTQMKVDGKEVAFKAARKRGAQVEELDATGKPVHEDVFDTFQSSEEVKRFVDFIKAVPKGNIVMVAQHDEMSRMMDADGYSALQSIGGSGEKLRFRETFALIGRKGDPPNSAALSGRELRGAAEYGAAGNDVQREVHVKATLRDGDLGATGAPTPTAAPTTTTTTAITTAPVAKKASLVKASWGNPYTEIDHFSKDLGRWLRDRTNDVMLVFNVTMPSKADDGLLFESGGRGCGAFVGIANGKFRISAGDGGSAPSDESDKDTAVLSIALPDARIPLDAGVHEIAVLVQTSVGKIWLYVDAKLIDSAASTSGLFRAKMWQGGDNTGFGEALPLNNIASGGVSTKWRPYADGGTMRMWRWTSDEVPLMANPHDTKLPEATLKYSDYEGKTHNFEKRKLVEGVVAWTDRKYTYSNVRNSKIPYGTRFWAGPHKTYGISPNRKVTIDAPINGVAYFWSEPGERDGDFPMLYKDYRMGTMNWGEGGKHILQTYEMAVPKGKTDIMMGAWPAGFTGGYAWAPEGQISVEVHSGNQKLEGFTYMKVNEERVWFDGKLRGAQVVELDRTGNVVEKKVFDTFQSREESTAFANFIKAVPLGNIVLVAQFDEMSENLDDQAYDALKSIGGSGKSLLFGETFALIGRKGDKKDSARSAGRERRGSVVYDTVGKKAKNKVSVGAVLWHGSFN